MHHIFPWWIAVFVVTGWCSSASAQSCSLQLHLTSPADNSIVRTNDVLRVETVNSTASSSPSIRDGWIQVGILHDGYGSVIEFADEMEYFHYPVTTTLWEGSNNFELIGWLHKPWPLPQCEASDTVRVFYMRPNDACYAMVEELDKIPQPPNDPTNGFVINQRCVAKYSCGNRPQMKDKTWLTKVVPAFVQPFLDKSGKWNEVIEECRQQNNLLPRYVRKRSCEKWMADYHIKQDLQGALNTNGCGVLPDWDEVGGYINECISEQNNALEAAVANLIVAKNRNNVRRNCIQQNDVQNVVEK
ncbi:hypothetical protein [Collimonas fungivorans]|nr:hypothetical protein [Collimonas fungivorans]